MPPVTPDAKRACRRRIRAARRERAAATSVAERDALALLLSMLVRNGPARGCRCVAAFASLPTEPPTEVLVADLLGEGVEVILPVIRPDLDLDWRHAQDDEPLGIGALARADVVIAPGLAVDERGRRLGQGGGSYDRALPRRRPGVPVVVLLFDGEVIDGSLPADPHDVPVDGVVTSAGWRPLPHGGRGLRD